MNSNSNNPIFQNAGAKLNFI